MNRDKERRRQNGGSQPGTFRESRSHLHVALNVHGTVAEGGLRLPLGLLHQRQELVHVGCQPHPAASAARRRLDHQREPDLLGALDRLLVYAPDG